MRNHICSFQIEEAFKNIGDEDIENKFVGTFPLNHMNKLINHNLIICEKKKYPFIIASTDASNKSGNIGGAYSRLNLKLTFFSLILVELMA